MWPKGKIRATGPSGRMLQTSLLDVLDDGEVSGCVLCDLTPEEAKAIRCGWCAREPKGIVGMEWQFNSEREGRTLPQTVSLCQPLCSSCLTTLMQGLKKTIG